MPHLTMQYTANLAPLATRPLLLALNRSLIASGQFEPLDIKSRAIVLDDFLQGDADSGHAFIHVQLALLDGRSDEIKQTLAAGLLAALQAQAPAPHGNAMQLCVEVCDIHRASYAKAHY